MMARKAPVYFDELKPGDAIAWNPSRSDQLIFAVLSKQLVEENTISLRLLRLTTGEVLEQKMEKSLVLLDGYEIFLVEDA